MPTPYRERILDHYQYPRHRGHLTAPDRVGKAENPLCGDQVQVELRLSDEGTIAEVAFSGEGCVIALAAASMLTEHIRGQSLEEVRRIGEADVAALLGMDLRPARQACARVAMEALRDAINRHEQPAEARRTSSVGGEPSQS